MMRPKKHAVRHYKRVWLEPISIQPKHSQLLRKFKAIEETLGSFPEKSLISRIADHVKDNEDVSGLLEDVREAINDYQVCLQSQHPPRC
jgi:hypothetical protein